MGLAEIPREYNLASLRRADLDPDPFSQFKKWFDQATGARPGGRARKFFIGLYKSLMLLTGAEPADVNAATLATADKSGRPSARVVLLKGIDERGFIFFTNYESRKARELSENPHAAMVFYWSDLERQVCVKGMVSKLSPEESETYFKTRPKGSRLAAWASKQSEVIESRAVLEQRWNERRAQYPGEEVPRPPWWGGYVLSPASIEFWQGRASRLHDRFRYAKQADNVWRVERLSP
jgi:pyridoxamine 5'-phosphate oxidase